MGRFFEIVKREGKHGFNLVLESTVTGECFFLNLEKRDPEFPLLSELKAMYNHALEMQQWVKDGVITMAGKQVIFNKVYY